MAVAVSHPAGLSSGQAQRAADRGAVCTDARLYNGSPYIGAGMTVLSLSVAEDWSPAVATSPGSPSRRLVTHRSTNPLTPQYALPGSSPTNQASCLTCPTSPDTYGTLHASLPKVHHLGPRPHAGSSSLTLSSGYIRPQNLDVRDINHPWDGWTTGTAAAAAGMTHGSLGHSSPGGYPRDGSCSPMPGQHGDSPGPRLTFNRSGSGSGAGMNGSRQRFASVPSSPAAGHSRLGSNSSTAVAAAINQYAYFYPPAPASPAGLPPPPPLIPLPYMPHAVSVASPNPGAFQAAFIVGGSGVEPPAAAAAAAAPALTAAEAEPLAHVRPAGEVACVNGNLRGGSVKRSVVNPSLAAPAALPSWNAIRHDPLDIKDIVPPRQRSPVRPLKSLQTADVPGARVRQPCGTHIPSPGQGTLQAQDIAGASPGCPLTGQTSAILAALTTGRWPHPQPPKPHFAQAARRTVLQRPLDQIGD